MVDSLKEKWTQERVWVILAKDEQLGIAEDDFGYWYFSDDIRSLVKYKSKELAESKLELSGMKKRYDLLIKECIYTRRDILLPADMIVGGNYENN